MNKNIKKDDRCTLMLKILSYDNKQPAGIIHCADSNTSFTFQNFTQLLMHIDKPDSLPDTEPQISEKERVFAMARSQRKFSMVSGKKSWIEEKKRSLSDFRIDIYFRNFGAWQGEMTCMDSGRRGAFRSVIELALMLDHELETARARDLRKAAGA